MKTLKDLKIGKSGTILKIRSKGALKQRFMDMGITKGVAIKVTKLLHLATQSK